MIPILFNHDDINNEKKGNVRAQDLATVISTLAPDKVGVLKVFDNPCTAYNTSVATGFATLTFHKGYILIYGRLIYIEEGEQVQVQIPTDSSTVYGSFGVRINLAESGSNEVSWFTKTGTLQQDDLVNNEIDGVYEFLLYTYTATSGSIRLTKQFHTLQDTKDFMLGSNFPTRSLDTMNGSVATTLFVHQMFANVIDYQKTYYHTNNAIELNREQTRRHDYYIIDFCRTRIIYGRVYNCPGNVQVVAWWNKGTTLPGKIYAGCSLKPTDRPIGQGLDEPAHFMDNWETSNWLAVGRPEIGKQGGEDGFGIYDSNGQDCDIDYIIIGDRP